PFHLPEVCGRCLPVNATAPLLPRASSFRYRSSRSDPRRPPFRARVFPTVLLAEVVKVALRACGARLHLDDFTSGKSRFACAGPGGSGLHPMASASLGRWCVRRIIVLLERKTLSRF